MAVAVTTKYILGQEGGGWLEIDSYDNINQFHYDNSVSQ
jgi:hypothetical protein